MKNMLTTWKCLIDKFLFFFKRIKFLNIIDRRWYINNN